MLGLVTEPGRAGSTRVEAAGEVLLRVLEVGVCGTDREISEGHFGTPPPGDARLVLGHELFAVVERDGHGFARGDLVTATVRRPCPGCLACEAGSPDSCLTGAYEERGITRLDGFARERLAEDAEELIAIPAALGRLGVLAEPTSVCVRALRHARAIGARQPWEPRRALVVGAGAIGMLATILLRLDGLDVWTAALEARDDSRAELARAFGAEYLSTRESAVAELGGFDLVVMAAGDAQLAADTLGLLRRSGVACLLGIDLRDQQVAIEGPVIGFDAVLENRVVFGSVNSRREDWPAAVDALARARSRWPDVLDALVGLRVPLDRFADAFAHPGVKATLVLDG
jgi:glucose 1-dehydrogenase